MYVFALIVLEFGMKQDMPWWIWVLGTAGSIFRLLWTQDVKILTGLSPAVEVPKSRIEIPDVVTKGITPKVNIWTKRGN